MKNIFRKSFFILLALVAIAVNFKVDIYAKDYPANPIKKDGWRLDFSCEFEGDKLDESKFSDSYLPHWTTYEKSLANYEMKDGKIILKIDENQEGWKPGSEQKISGIASAMRDGLHRYGKDVELLGHNRAKSLYETRYGYFEIRAKAQVGGGIHSAWWMVGQQKNANEVTEIDIFEILGKNIHSDYSKVNTSVHCWADPQRHEENLNYYVYEDLGDEFHVYGFEWDENGMKFYFDNELVRESSQSPDYKMATILSLYESPSNLWSGRFDETVPYPKTFEIDYFRVYKREGSTQEVQEKFFDNLALDAEIGFDESYNWERPISNVADNDLYTAFESKENPSFSKYLYFDWEEGKEFNTVALRAWYAKSQAPISWEIQVSQDGLSNWESVARVSEVNWKYDSNIIEEKLVKFPTVRDKKSLRIKIDSANLNWNHYAINEIQIYDDKIFEENINLLPYAINNNEYANGYINDGNSKTAYQSKDYYFNFKNESLFFEWKEPIRFDKLIFKAWYAKLQAPTKIDVLVSIDGENWSEVKKDLILDWKEEGSKIESIQIDNCNTGTIKYMQVKVKEANLHWKHFAINEIEVYSK